MYKPCTVTEKALSKTNLSYSEAGLGVWKGSIRYPEIQKTYIEKKSYFWEMFSVQLTLAIVVHICRLLHPPSI